MSLRELLSLRPITSALLISSLIASLSLLIRLMTPSPLALVLSSLIFTVVVFFLARSISAFKYTEELRYHEVIVNETIASLVLEDKDGKVATYKKRKELTTEWDDVRRYTEKRFWTDGDANPPEIEGDVDYKILRVPDTKNEYDLVLQFKYPMNKGDKRKFTLTYIMNNSFKKSTESFETYFTNPSKFYSFTVKFPNDRLVRSAWVELNTRGKDVKPDIKGVHISQDFREINYTVRNAFPGLKCILYWRW